MKPKPGLFDIMLVAVMLALIAVIAFMLPGCTPTVKCTRPHVVKGRAGGQPAWYIYEGNTVETIPRKDVSDERLD